MIQRLLLVVTLLTLHIEMTAQLRGKEYLSAKATKGQGVLSLLRTYKLLDKKCNLEAFYEINKLVPGAELKNGKSYKLPILKSKYDGKSIRTSVDIANYETARAIQEFNQDLFNAKLKKSDYKSSRELWIPLYYEGCPIQEIGQKSKHTLIDKNFASTRNSLSLEPIKALNSTPKSQDKRILVADTKLDEELFENEFNQVENSNRRPINNSVNDKSFTRKVSNKMVKVSLFGKEKSEVPIESDELKDQIFYIVPGHGGPDPGALAKLPNSHTICEDEYAYDVSLRLARNLIIRGATVHIIVQDKNDGIRDERYLDCDEDEKVMGGLEMPISQKKRLRQGMVKVNQLYLEHKLEGFKKQWMVSIHIDSQPEENRQDVFFYYQADSKKSKRKAKDLQKVFTEKYQEFQGRDYNGDISTRPLYVIRASQPDPIFIELANIRNPKDQERILSPKNRQVLADWLLQGFLD
ncbi:MAG: N-acetylmuramoyl-L-alanine amidase [Saprospiraceae bacterium]|nr:N-acetylmuramoyl-L-alanine amidase [Candidatus Vicinibacter affinis]MBP6172073.1 N-acetylmuramoyl-L-alanine amidase [Saprospiraceae bacterium]MBK6822767.1 N-acetylmuramoyl-L-alanine amidase [Candidatus Vicinibacter affinis]MBK7304867.1 N-acetylmuramoyl-L-alanine amidase [Candidatus Vicinibacter affinis]MBK7694632.1 N-acetylmuramoyl-L-alanine amidase [Candidatus Vicinibacter affinis]